MGNLSRRDFLKVLGTGVVGGIAGNLGAKLTGNALRSLMEKIDPLNHTLIPEFNVEIFNQEGLENFRFGTELKKLVIESKNNGYLKISYNAPSFSDVKVYHNWLVSNNEGDSSKSYFCPRPIGKEDFTYVANGPAFRGHKMIYAHPIFLDNKQLLVKVVEGANLRGTSNFEDSFSDFDLNSEFGSGCNLDSVPYSCDLQIKGDNVHYKIKGLDVLAGGDKKLFSEFWIAKNRYKDFDDFLIDYKRIQRISKESIDANTH